MPETIGAPATLVGRTIPGHSARDPSCARAGAPEVAYRFVAPLTGTYRFDTVGSSFDAVLYVLDPNNCQQLACADDVIKRQAELLFSAGADQELVVVVDGFEVQQDGWFELHAARSELARGSDHVVVANP